MTSSTTPPDAGRHHPRRAGFTLVEVMISATLSTFILAGVLSSFLMLGRSGMNIAGYSESESQIRRGIEEFSKDVRMANNITWNSASSVTLTVPNNYMGNANKVTYAYDNATSGETARSFYRMAGDPSSNAVKTAYIRDLTSFSFARFNRVNDHDPAANDAETKRLQITMNVRKAGQTLVAANTTLVSASFTLRNKVAN